MSSRLGQFGTPDLEHLIEIDRKHIIHPMSDLNQQFHSKLKFVCSGRGSNLTMLDGRTLLDGLSGLISVNVGHGRHSIAEVAAAQMQELAYYPSFKDYSHKNAGLLANTICELFPSEYHLQYCLFSTSGSEANEANFKIARLYHALNGNLRKTKILSRSWSYHGTTDSTNSANGLSHYRLFCRDNPDHKFFSTPYCHRCEFQLSPQTCDIECVKDLRAVIEKEDPDTVAAIIVEPVSVSSGVLIPPEEYFAELQAICRQHNILIIFDEVVTGFGRSGRWFGMEHWDVAPDLVSLGKGITSGYFPLSASVVSKRVFDSIRENTPLGSPFTFGLTFSNHPVGCAVALENIRIIQEENLVSGAHEKGVYALEQLQKAVGGSPIVSDIRGFGLAIAIEVMRPSIQKFPDSQLVNWISAKCFDEGLVVGSMIQSIGFAPALNVPFEVLDDMISILSSVIWRAEKRFG